MASPRSKEPAGSQAAEESSKHRKKKSGDGGCLLELNLRRTQLQLGLPGSPEADDDGGRSGHALSSSSSSCHKEDASPPADKQDLSQSRAPVGWPPVQSFRKNSLAPNQQQPSSQKQPVCTDLSNHGYHQQRHQQQQQQQQQQKQQQQRNSSSLFVKVYMDGVPIGRKVNLRSHGGYDKLSIALEDMFRRFIGGQTAASGGATKAVTKLTESKKFNFIYGSDYVLTYEDKDGDLMLVGDVPWELFVGNVKRLRIMKGSEAIGLAPRNGDGHAAAAG